MPPEGMPRLPIKEVQEAAEGEEDVSFDRLLNKNNEKNQRFAPHSQNYIGMGWRDVIRVLLDAKKRHHQTIQSGLVSMPSFRTYRSLKMSHKHVQFDSIACRDESTRPCEIWLRDCEIFAAWIEA